MAKVELRPYQKEISAKALTLLREKKIAYLAMEVRTGKTLTALNTANDYGAKRVLFLTKKRAIKSIQDDYNALQTNYEIVIINNESLHTILTDDFDIIISDEHHRNSSFPKPNNTTKEIKRRFGHLPMIFLSGTPAIESGSQWYHSFWVSNHSPFNLYKNFYQWARIHTNKKVRHFGSVQVPDYSDSIDEIILPIIEPYLLKFTQQQAGFNATITEKVLYCQMSNLTNSLIEMLLKNEVIEGNEETILADTSAKMLSKIHQLSNGTIIFESGNSKILDTSKAEFIKTYFTGKKLGIFYNFKAEYLLLKQVFGDTLTDDLSEFNSTSKHIALQQVSGSEGLSLKQADALVYYSYGYSGKNYCQGRDRMTTIDRKFNEVYFVFQKDDINSKIYKAIKSKKRYNEKLFIQDYYGRRK
jgi:hypothetical protein